MATSLDKLENKVHIHHLHVKRFYMVKILRKSVQYVLRYSMKYACFLAVSYLTFSNELHYLGSYPAEVHQIFTGYSHIISAVIARTFRQWHCNSFSNDSAKNASGISQRSWHFTKINWLPWQRPLRNRKKWTGSRKFTQTPSAFGEKIVKIGPVDTEIALLIVKEEEINAIKIYSPVGRFAGRAK